MELLIFLATRQGRLVTRKEIIEQKTALLAVSIQKFIVLSSRDRCPFTLSPWNVEPLCIAGVHRILQVSQRIFGEFP